jgi:hypothetical protein
LPTASTSICRAPAVGDSLRDLQAAAAVGAQPLLVMTGKGAQTQAEGGLPEGTLVFADLAAAADHILLVVMAAFRTALHAAGQSVDDPFRVLVTLAIAFPMPTRYRIIALWRSGFMALCRYVLGIRYRVLGRENMPAEPSVVLAKHQSAWETVGLQEIFPPLVFVLKKELLRVPFFGWGLAAMKMISIDRAAAKDALKQVFDQGRERLPPATGW